MSDTRPDPRLEAREKRCPTCGQDGALSAEEANCLNVEVHGLPKRCPECGAMGMLWHKLGCSLDASPDPEAVSADA